MWILRPRPLMGGTFDRFRPGPTEARPLRDETVVFPCVHRYQATASPARRTQTRLHSVITHGSADKCCGGIISRIPKRPQLTRLSMGQVSPL